MSALNAISSPASLNTFTPFRKIQLPSRNTVITMVGVLAITSIPVANAITYTECFENCQAHQDAHPLAVLICQALCALFSEPG